MSIRVRVRGIYATAISVLLREKGVQLVNVSKVLQERLNLPANAELPADATIKDSNNDPHELLIIGFPEEVNHVINILVDALEYLVIRRSKLNLYSSYKPLNRLKKSEDCLFEILPGIYGKLARGYECKDYPAVHVVRGYFGGKDYPIVAPGLTIVGEYLILTLGDKPRVTFSEHIKSEDRRLALLALSMKYKERGLSIHWRSSSSSAPLEKLSEELNKLVGEIEAMYKKIGEAEPGTELTKGEHLALVGLTEPAKSILDNYRSRAISTIKYHHMIKAMNPREFQSLVDFSEYLVSRLGIDSIKAGEALLDYIITNINTRRIEIHHIKPTGERILLGPARLEEAKKLENGSWMIKIRRLVKGSGVYDGLGIEKEPGDYIETIITTGHWYIIHKYFSQNGELKGVYININTPPEISLDKIRYYDLYIDIAYTAQDTPRVIDREELDNAYKQGLITKQLYEKALSETEKLLHRLKTEKIINPS